MYGRKKISRYPAPVSPTPPLPRLMEPADRTTSELELSPSPIPSKNVASVYEGRIRYRMFEPKGVRGPEVFQREE